MKRLLFAVAVVVACAGCPPDAPDPHPPVTSGVVDDECAGGGVAVGFPLRPGSYTVGQGNGGAFSHTGINQFAWDFTVDEGTDVVAARGGTVVFVVDGFGAGGPDPARAVEANVVVVDHGAGTFDSYFHLLAGSFVVGVGDVVHSGDVLGRSGNSGFTSGPHLHFAVVDDVMQSLPACFEPGDLRPATDDDVAAVPSPLPEPTSFPRSSLAADTFAGSAVIIDNDLPAFSIDGTLHVEGHVTDGNHRAVVFLAPPGGGDAIAQQLGDVDGDGGFVIDLDASAYAGVRALAMSSVDDDTGAFAAAVLAPVVITAR